MSKEHSFRALSNSTVARLEHKFKKVNLGDTARVTSPPFYAPVHVFYGGAHLFRADTSAKMGRLALRALEQYATSAEDFGKIFGINGDLASSVFQRTIAKLSSQPIEDYRIDFEDGFGLRTDKEEDEVATRAAVELTTCLLQADARPNSFGIRVKPLNKHHFRRSVRTLDIFFSEVAARLGAPPTECLCITLPKVMSPQEPAALARLCSNLESGLGITEGSMRVELMIEQAQTIFDSSGRLQIAALINAAEGRCSALHFGPHDYAASRKLISSDPLAHLSSDVVRELMLLAIAGSNVRLVDGPTSILPVATYSAASANSNADEQRSSAATIQSAWRLHFGNVRRALDSGIYAGWDLHPAQLPARFAATYSFFEEKIGPLGTRLKSFLGAAAGAMRTGQQFDDAAMANQQLCFIRQALRCGAVSSAEVEVATGLSEHELLHLGLHEILAKRF